MKAKDYSKAALDSLQSGMSFDDMFTGLTAVISKRGHTRLLPAILKQLLVDLQGLTDTETGVVSVSKKSDLEKYSKEINAALTALGAPPEYKTDIDETIIGGYSVTAHQKTITNTYKRKLINLYRESTR